MTNSIPPAAQDIINALPPAWQRWAPIVMLCLMAVGRILYANHIGASWFSGLLSIFAGSHSATQAPPLVSAPPPAAAPMQQSGPTLATWPNTPSLPPNTPVQK